MATGEVQALAQELTSLAERGYRRAFRPVGRKGPLDLPQLYGIIEQLHGHWETEPEAQRVEIIASVLRRAIRRLPDRTVRNTRVIFKRAAALLYDLEPIGLVAEQHGNAKRYAMLTRIVLQEAGVPETATHKDRITSEVRAELTVALRKLVSESVAGETEQADGSNDPNSLGGEAPYVARSSYHAAFKRLVEQGTKLIALVGEPGTGKTRLARAVVAAELQGLERAVWLRGDQLTNDMAGELASRHMDSAAMSSADDTVRAFAVLMRSDNAPAYVLVDNLESPELIRPLVHPANKSVIVVTSREDVLPGVGERLIVEAMADAEATELVLRLLPTANDEDVAFLVRMVGARPLALVHACGFIGSGKFYSIDDFCTDMTSDPALALERTARPVADTLTWIYRMTLQRLRASDEDAARLLEYLAVLHCHNISEQLLISALTQGEADAGWSPGRLRSGIRELERRLLVQVRDDGLVMHELTQHLLGGILRPEAEFNKRCIQVMRAIRDMMEREELPIDERWSLAIHLYDTMQCLIGIDPETRRDAQLASTFVILARAAARFGHEPGVGAVIALYTQLFGDTPTDDYGEVEGAFRTKIRLEFSSGRLDPRSYLHILTSVISAKRSADFRPEDLDLTDIMDLGLALIESGDSEEAVSLLRGQESRLFRNDERGLEHGDYQTLLAEGLIAQGEWPLAWSGLQAAMKNYQAVGYTRQSVTGMLRVLRAYANCYSMSGNSSNLDTFLERGAYQFWPFFRHRVRLFTEPLDTAELEEASQYVLIDDSDALAYYFHAIVVARGQRVLQRYYSSLSQQQPPQKLSDDLTNAARGYFDALAYAWQAYSAAWDPRSIQILAHDAIVVRGLAARDVAESWLATASRLQEQLQFVRYGVYCHGGFIAFAKLSLLPEISTFPTEYRPGFLSPRQVALAIFGR